MKDLFNLIISVLSLLFWTNTSKAADISHNYILQFKAIAQSEMQRTGIPASIKLAQGILESNKGQSELAIHANNHFGIKCGKHWTGNGFRLEDDDYNDRGELIKSCFRVYGDAYESYIGHSDLLTNPRSAYRYGHLFELDPYDYKKWAHGLKKSGYATDPKYPDKLISVIEKYELYQFDLKEKEEILVENYEMPAAAPPAELNHYEHHTGVKWVTNEQNPTRSNGSQKSNNRSTKLEGYHKVLLGETAKQISRKYGITEKELYAYNRIPFNSAINIGSQLKIDGYLHWGDRAPFSNVKTSPETDLLFANEVVESF